MPVLTIAIAVALGIVLMLRKARFHYERLPKIPYVAGAVIPEVAIVPPPVASSEEYETSFPEEMIVSGGIVPPEPEWILLLGEQTKYARVFLPSLTQYAVDEELDMVSVFLKPEPQGFLEMLLAPYAMALFFAGVNSSRVNAHPPSESLASGHCLLLRRRAYERLGRPGNLDYSRIPAEKGIRARVARAEHMGSVTGMRTGFQRYRAGMLRRGPFSALQSALTGLLLLLWLPILALLLLGAYYRQAALFALLPTVVLFPWYRNAKALLAPAVIYLFPLLALKNKPAAADLRAAGDSLDHSN